MERTSTTPDLFGHELDSSVAHPAGNSVPLLDMTTALTANAIEAMVNDIATALGTTRSSMIVDNDATSVNSSDSDAPKDERPPATKRSRQLSAGVWRAFDIALQRRGLLRVQEEGDGNCLYRALARQLLGSPDDHMTMRQHLCDQILRNATDYALYMDEGESVHDYVARMRTRSSWGGLIELIAVEELFNRAVVIYNIDDWLTHDTVRESRTFVPQIPPDFLSTACPVQPVRVVYSRNHYDSAAPITAANFPLGVGQLFNPLSGQPIDFLTFRKRVGPPAPQPPTASAVPTCDPAPPPSATAPRPKKRALDKKPDTDSRKRTLHAYLKPEDPNAPSAPEREPLPEPPTHLSSRPLHLQPARATESQCSSPFESLPAQIIIDASPNPNMLREPDPPATPNTNQTRPALSCAIRLFTNLDSRVINKQIQQRLRGEDDSTWKASATLGSHGGCVPLVQCTEAARDTLTSLLLAEPRVFWLDEDTTDEKPQRPDRLTTFTSVNINSIANKIPDLIDLIEHTNSVICAVQETRLALNAVNTLRLQGHTTVQCAAEGASKTGVALVIANAVQHEVIDNAASPFYVAIRTMNVLEATPMQFLSIYVPCAGQPNREVALEHIGMAITAALAAKEEIAIGGDWNMTANELLKWAAQWPGGLHLNNVQGNRATRHTSTGRVHRDIDHILSSNPDVFAETTIIRDWEASDHWPVSAKISRPLKVLPTTTDGQRFLPRRMWETKTGLSTADLAAKLAEHNAFHNIIIEPVLKPTRWRLPIQTDGELDKYAVSFEKAVWTAAKDIGIAVTATPPQQAGHSISEEMRQLLKDKRTLHIIANECSDAAVSSEARRRYYSKKAEIAEAMLQEEQTRKLNRFDHSTSIPHRGSREVWRTVSYMCGQATKSNVLHPIQRTDGKLATDPEDIRNACFDHANRLLGVHSELTDAHWTDRISVKHATPAKGQLVSLDWPAISNSILRMQSGTAPGPDGIPIDFYKLIMQYETPMENQPQSLHEAAAQFNNTCKVKPVDIPEGGHGDAWHLSASIRYPDIRHHKDIGPIAAKTRAEEQRQRDIESQGPNLLVQLRNSGARKRMRGHSAETRSAAALSSSANSNPKTGRHRISPGDTPRSACGAALLRLCRGTWNLTRVPPSMRRADWVMILKKGGDPSICGNYRGISLINTVIKIISSAINDNLDCILEAGKRTIREQAGFRKGEECIAQVISLYEVCRRRMSNKWSTALLFVDFEKAFDKVDARAIQLKLQRLGYSGPPLDFIMALYATTEMQLRFPGGVRSGVIEVRLGVRQGCPLSPTIFKVHINDILDIFKSLQTLPGVAVPGLIDKFIGLLFADDTVLAAGNFPDLVEVVQGLLVWCEENGMPVNPAKCAYMIIAWCPAMRRYWEDHMAKFPELLRMRDTPVEVVHKYTYLGLGFDDTLDLRTMAAERHGKARSVIQRVAGVLGNTMLPVTTRVDVVRLLVMSTLLYGVELWGISGSAVHSAQAVVTEAMRMVAGISPHAKSTTSVAALQWELGIPPVAAIAKARIHRICTTAASKSTWIQLFAKYNPPKRTRGSWWVAATRIVEQISALRLPTDSTANLTMAIWQQDEGQSPSASALRYHIRSLRSTAPHLPNYFYPAKFSAGLQLLMRVRLNALILSHRLTRQKSPTQQGFCWMCMDENASETVEHYLLVCPLWSAQRHEFIEHVITAARLALRQQLERCTNTAVLTLLIGGTSVGGAKLEHWRWPRPVKHPGHHSAGAPRINWRTQPFNICVAQFLQTTWKIRSRMIARNRDAYYDLSDIPAEEKATDNRR